MQRPAAHARVGRCDVARTSRYHWLIGARADFVIRDAATGAFAGDIGLFTEPPTGQAMIGYSVAREWRGRGFATRAARLVTDWAFDEVGIVRVDRRDRTGQRRLAAVVGEGRLPPRRRTNGPGCRAERRTAYRRRRVSLLPSDRQPPSF